MSTDLEIRSFKNSIIDFMNKTPLATEIKRLVLSEILAETTMRVDTDIRTEIQNLKETEPTKESDPENSPE